MNKLREVLPTRYAPIQQDGRGKQGVYLARVPDTLMQALVDLIGWEAKELVNMSFVSDEVGLYGQGLIEWEEHLSQEILDDKSLEETEKQQIILARRGQGQFRNNVQMLESHCRVTCVDRPDHLRASHCKPWRDCKTADERLDGENGLLLTPSIDHLFDRGFISFEDNGELLVSPVAHKISLQRMGIPEDKLNVSKFSEGQKRYLDYHRNSVFLEAKTR